MPLNLGEFLSAKAGAANVGVDGYDVSKPRQRWHSSLRKCRPSMVKSPNATAYLGSGYVAVHQPKRFVMFLITGPLTSNTSA